MKSRIYPLNPKFSKIRLILDQSDAWFSRLYFKTIRIVLSLNYFDKWDSMSNISTLLTIGFPPRYIGWRIPKCCTWKGHWLSDRRRGIHWFSKPLRRTLKKKKRTLKLRSAFLTQTLCKTHIAICNSNR